MALPVDLVVAVTAACAATLTLPPVELKDTPLPTAATLLTVALSMPAAAAMPRSALESPPDWLLLCESALLAALPKLGTLWPPPLFGLLLTWLLLSVSALLPLELLPCALAVTLSVLVAEFSTKTVMLPPALMERSAVALVSSVSRLMPTEGPMPTELPAALASALVVALEVSVARISTAPLAWRVAVGSVPGASDALVWLLVMASATPAPIPTPPPLEEFAEAPFSAVVLTLCVPNASIRMLPAVPFNVAWASTVADVVVFALFMAKEAPTPTELPLAPPLLVGTASASKEVVPSAAMST